MVTVDTQNWTVDHFADVTAVFTRPTPPHIHHHNAEVSSESNAHSTMHQLIEHGLPSLPTQYRLYARPFLQVKRPNQQYQSTEGTHRIRN